MAADSPTISVKEVSFNVLPMKTRFPFKYGIASMTALPHLFVTAQVEVNGYKGQGVSAEGLSPKWFTKDPKTTFEQDLPQMFEVIRNAAAIAQSVSSSRNFFHWWRDIYDSQAGWAASSGIPPLLTNLGVSLIERSVLDGFCRVLKTSLASALHSNILGIKLGDIYPELEGRIPADSLPPKPLRKIIVRHTIGLGDPLTNDEIKVPLNDGLPYSLEACIKTYSLNYFKIKLCGSLDRDLDRLRRIRQILENTVKGDYQFTLDGNEQYRDIETFKDHWQTCCSDHEIRALFKHLLFVEQPLHRDHALDENISSAMGDCESTPLVIIDESDAEIGSVLRALDLGYAGTSHKNCKGIVKGIANAALLEHRRHQNPGKAFILSGEDLANVGPIALLQDLTLMAILGITHVERNGHHYFKGLSMLPKNIQNQILENHGDLYIQHEKGYPTVNIQNSRVSIASLLDSPFGTGFTADLRQFTSLEDWMGNS